MNGDTLAYVSEADAAAVWRRAAELQSESERRPADQGVPVGVRRGGDEAVYPITDIEAAAATAGIAEEFVRQALGETLARPQAEAPGQWDRLVEFLLGRLERQCTTSRLIAGDVEVVLTALERFLPAYPYRLSLADTWGDPRAGGKLVFDLPQDGSPGENRLRHVAAIGARRLSITLRPVREERQCELSIAVHAQPRLEQHGAEGAVLIGFSGAGGALLGALAGIKLLSLAGAILLGPAAAGAYLVGSASVAGYRAYFRANVRAAKHELDQMAGVIDANVRTRGAFGVPAAPAVLERSTDAVIMVRVDGTSLDL